MRLTYQEKTNLAKGNSEKEQFFFLEESESKGFIWVA